jgi:hypothetical protein
MKKILAGYRSSSESPWLARPLDRFKNLEAQINRFIATTESRSGNIG